MSWQESDVPLLEMPAGQKEKNPVLRSNVDFPTALKLRPYTKYLPRADTVLAVQKFSVMFRKAGDQCLFIISNWDRGSIWCRWAR